MLRVVPGLILLTITGGCQNLVDGSPSDFGGSFTRSATQENIDDFRGIMQASGADDVLIMESFPMQFRVMGPRGWDCENARSQADGLVYVANTSPCRDTTTSRDGDEPTATTISS